MADPATTAAGYIRTGECNRCGECCIGCPAYAGGEPAVCLAREDVNNPDHEYYTKQCSLFPQVPYVTLTRCSYVFTRIE